MRPFGSTLYKALVGPGVLACSLLASSVPFEAAAEDDPADAHAPRLVVLRRDEASLSVAQREDIDRLLMSSVTNQLSFASTYASEVPLDDIELAAGCSARDPDCTQRLVSSVGADWLLVRELTRDREGRTYLTLVAHDGPGALITRRVVSQIAGATQAGGALTPEHVVPMLVQRLYPQAPVVTEEPVRRPRWSAANVVGWSAAGAGASLLIAGTTMGVLSHKEHEAYQHAQIRHPQDVDHAESLLARSQQRARIANGFLIGGAAAGLAGAATLLWTYLRPSAEVQKDVRVGLNPARSGVQLQVAGSWRGGL